MTLAMGSIRILIRNRRLLWFSFLSGLAMLFSLLAAFGLQYLSGIDPFSGRSLVTVSQAALIGKGSPAWIACTFSSQFVAVFWTAFLLAGLIACVSLLFSGRAPTIREGLSAAGGRLQSVAGWAAVFAAAGTAQSVFLNLYPGAIIPAFIMGVCLLLVGLLVIFVIPVLVLEGKSLAGAVAESLSLFRKAWGEVILCCFFIVLIAFAIGMVSLLPMVSIGFGSGNPALLGATIALYFGVLMIAIVIGSTLVGIALVGLYSYAKTGRIPGIFVENMGERH